MTPALRADLAATPADVRIANQKWWRGQRDRLRARTAHFAPTPPQGRGEAFTAWATCPSCGTCAVHSLRLPDTEGFRRRLAEYEDRLAKWTSEVQRTNLVAAWPYRVVDIRRHHPSGEPEPTPPFFEHGYEIIRQCTCGHEWGQS